MCSILFINGLKIVLNNGVHVTSVHVYLRGSEDTLKSHFVKNIYNAVLKILHFNYKDPETPTSLLPGLTWISAANIGETIIHSALGVTEKVFCFKWHVKSFFKK